ncbi:hypothetical protein DF3PB_30041 [uncultured Defluviicoccus sp.]|uniref:Uncharacterized protein n=1 Tax=metagenome TaxID=256318 RepID=A0A380TEM2_9ZZZZ|nr:hypothetical protein DF3PB_30041 [uncultured Defluviicoccus sp.]
MRPCHPRYHRRLPWRLARHGRPRVRFGSMGRGSLIGSAGIPRLIEVPGLSPTASSEFNPDGLMRSPQHVLQLDWIIRSWSRINLIISFDATGTNRPSSAFVSSRVISSNGSW